jgi:hypothetical protein
MPISGEDSGSFTVCIFPNLIGLLQLKVRLYVVPARRNVERNGVEKRTGLPHGIRARLIVAA